MKRVVRIALLLLAYTVFGILGFRIIEGARWLDCVYLTVITLSTVGYGEVIELSDVGRMFTIAYIVAGLGVFMYSGFELGQWIVSTEFQTLLEKKRMKQSLNQLDDHYIICGFGRMGETIAQYLHGRKKPFVVIDADESRLKPKCVELGWPCIHGDATKDETLIQAGIHRARSLATVLSTDADNVYVVLSARMLASELPIIARASEEKALQKLEHAGASRVISPFSSGAVKMARFMISPTLEEFFDVTDARGHGFELADVQITADSPYANMSLAETDLIEKGIIVVGIRCSNGDNLMPPPSSTTIKAGDCLFIFGSRGAVNAVVGVNEAQDRL